MIKVNIATLEIKRERLPRSLRGLTNETLRNLQTELNPVPVRFLNIEYWPENNITPVIDKATEKYGDEILTIDVPGKWVNVSKQVLLLNTSELAANLLDLENKEDESARQEINKISMDSLAEILEWVGSQPSSPQSLKAKRTAAADQRNNLHRP